MRMRPRGLIATTATDVSPDQYADGWWGVLIAALLACALVRVVIRVRGTTLTAPALWALASAIALASVEAVLAWRPALELTLGGSLLRYAAAVSMLCPQLAVLGAKRPQDRGWQWVVLAFWVTLLAPAFQAWAAHSGASLRLHPAWLFLIYSAAGYAAMNYLPTNWGFTAFLVALAQWKLIVVPLVVGRPSGSVGMSYTLLLLAAILPPLPWGRSTAKPPSTPLQSFTQRWLAFRDGWGSFWALRVKNRINETATLSNWPVRLQWNGFVACDGGPPEIDDRVTAQIQQSLDSLLWRFERNDKALSLASSAPN